MTTPNHRLPSLKAIAAAVACNPPRNRYKSDPKFRMVAIARAQIASAFKRSGFSKSGSTAKMLGCSFDELKRHVEGQFSKGMGWHNYGDWHIDHRIPISSAKTLEELEYLLHYMNLQPMWAGANMAKGADMPDSVQLHLSMR